ncbi:TPA: AAA family ATPase [Candidatus Poribacteria bacterium]|nr:AAA family ATPase [Candidatus Poribacteria bacterium]
MRDSEDSRRRSRRSYHDLDDFFRDFDNEETNIRALALVDQLLSSMNPKDKRRPLLYQIRRQLIEDELSFREVRQMIIEAQQTIIEMEGVVEKLTAPANRVGTYLGSPKEGIAYINVGGSDYYANIDPRMEISNLKIGASVLINEAYVVVGDLGYNQSGPVGRIADVMDDGRLRVGQEHGLQAVILQRSSDLKDSPLRTGDEVRIDPNYKVALERLGTQESQEYYLEKVPEVLWSMVGGQDEAIQAIKDAIELPLLHPELFQRFQFAQPKGFLLHGPPGCGKTLIGKATAYNLTQQLKNEFGEDTEGYFLHIKGPEILNMWLGESERKVREIFSIAKEKKKEGALSFVFIDEAESILGTRRAIRSHNIANTVVPMFCAEMDGIESLQDVVIILATNRPDLIDPAILRPGRIDRKIKVKRPGKAECKEIFEIYLTPDLPLDPKLLKEYNENTEEAVNYLIAQANDRLFEKRDEHRFLEVHLRSGKRDVLYYGDLASGALIASIVQRAKESAIKRTIASKSDEGISLDDILNAVSEEYKENDIFPPTDNTEDWMKLLDYDPENVVRITPIRPEKIARRKTPRNII